MQKNIKKRNKVSKIYILLFSFFILSWFLASLFTINRISFSVVTFRTSNLISPVNLEVDGKNSFFGKFKALDNNLGIVYVFFYPMSIDSEGTITFSFRQKGKKEWEFKESYDAKLFDSQAYFTFGIPPIKDSQDKIYEFKIESSNPKNSLSVGDENFVTGYQYSREDITSLSYESLRFFKNKVLGSISDLDFLYKSTIFLIPLFAFILSALFIKKVPINFRHFKILIPVLLVCTLILESKMPIVSFPLLILLWISFVLSYKLKSRFSLISGFFIIVIWIVVIPIGLSTLQSRLNEWGYALIFIGCMQLLIEERRNIEN